MRQEVDGNVPTLFYLARIAGVYFEPVAVAVNDTLPGNATGRLDPGETASIWFTIRNQAIHPLDSACSINANLMSLDTLVAVLDSFKSFPDVQRRSDVNNQADQFMVRASESAQPGDTIPLRLEVTFTDAGNTITMPVAFDVVLGEDVIAVSEASPGSCRLAMPVATIVGRVLFLRGSAADAGERTVLLNALGRGVLALHPGNNDVSCLVPGVYFARWTSQVAKVVISR
jgi:hypothetical protein